MISMKFASTLNNSGKVMPSVALGAKLVLKIIPLKINTRRQRV